VAPPDAVGYTSVAEEPAVELDEQGEAAGGLPLDIATLIIGLWRRKYIFAVCVMMFMGLAVVAADALGKKLYRASTVLVYKPQGADAVDVYTPLPLPTQLHLVKLAPNLEEVRARLHLSVKPRSIGEAITVHVEKQTQVLALRGEWDSAEGVAGIVRELRDVFLENQVRLRRKEIGKRILSLEATLASVVRKLEAADSELQKFTVEHRVVDLDKEAQWLLEELTSVNLLLDAANVSMKTNALQAENLDKVIADLKRRVAQEQQQSTSMDQLSNVNLRIQRLRESIVEDVSLRGRSVDLAQRQLEYETSKRLFDQGLISKVQLEQARAAYEKQRIVTEDSDQIKEWRGQIEKLDKVMIPSDDVTPSGRMLEEMMSKAFNIQLEQVSVSARVEHLQEALARVQGKLGTLPELQRTFYALTREVEVGVAEKKRLEGLLGISRRIHQTDEPDFLVVADAKQPVRPSKSNKKLVAIAVAALGFIFGLVLIAGLELLDRKLKSPADIRARTKLPVLAAIATQSADERSFSKKGKKSRKHERVESFDRGLPEGIKLATRRVTRMLPTDNRRLLVTACGSGEGTTSVTVAMAECFARRGHRVLVVDAHLEDRSDNSGITELAPYPEEGPPPSLGDFLLSPQVELESLVLPTVFPGVECIPRGRECSNECFDLPRMGELLEEADRHFGFVLIDGPPIGECLDADGLAQIAGGTLFVVRSRSCSAGVLKRTLARLDEVGCNVVGVVANDVGKLYMSYAS